MLLDMESRAHSGALGQSFDGLGKLAVFGTARSLSYAELFWLNNNRRFIFGTQCDYVRRGALTMSDLPFQDTAGMR
jgi:hypothetical protein